MKNLLKISNSAEDTRSIGRQLAESLIEEQQNIFLFGELGSGKTTLMQGFGEGLGIKEDIISPSFQLVRKYNTNGQQLIHLDLYRLKDINEILHLGWWDLLEEKGITAVEWADRAESILPEESIFLEIEHISENKRQIRVFNEKKHISGN